MQERSASSLLVLIIPTTAQQDQILAEARRIAAQGGSFVFSPLKPSLLPRQRQEGGKPATSSAGGKRPAQGTGGGPEQDIKRPRPATVEEKLFAAVPLQERPNVEWLKDSQVCYLTLRLCGAHGVRRLLPS